MAAVIGIIFKDNKKQVLAIKRRDVPVWVFPGGGINFEEQPEEAVIREILEETGLHVTIQKKVAEYTPINQLSLHTYLFECSIGSGQLTTGPETKEIAFFSIDQLPKPFFLLHEAWLKDALQNAPELIKKQISQVTYISVFFYFFKHPLLLSRLILSRLGFPINSQ